jgi:peptide/nickel transport system ATP-binding protein
VHAVDGVSLTIATARWLGLVGESGCGKSTLGRIVAGILMPERGRDAASTARPRRGRGARRRRRIQMIFQDPIASLNPRMRVGEIVGEAPRVHGIVPRPGGRLCRASWSASASIRTRPLSAPVLGRAAPAHRHRPRARAEAEVLVCDEPVAALDVSIQAQVLNLFMRLRAELG